MYRTDRIATGSSEAASEARHGDRERTRPGKTVQVAERLFIMCAGTSWVGVVSPARLMPTELAAHADILGVDPPISAATPDRYRYGASRIGVAPKLGQINDRIIRLTPRALPLHTRPYIKVSTAALVRSQT